MKECDHKWDGPVQWYSGSMLGSVTCSRCGIKKKDFERGFDKRRVLMDQWDYWRKQIAERNDDLGSRPRDWFESVLDELELGKDVADP